MMEMISIAHKLLIIGVHVVAIKSAATLTPLGVSSGVALTHPEQTGSVVVELVKNTLNSIKKGVFKQQTENNELEPDEAERLENLLTKLGQAQRDNRNSSLSFHHLKVADIQQTADLIGHKSLNTTRRYHRYFLDTNEKQSLNDQALDVE